LSDISRLRTIGQKRSPNSTSFALPAGMTSETSIAFSPTKVADLNLAKVAVTIGIINWFTILRWGSRGWRSNIASLRSSGRGGAIIPEGREGGRGIQP